MGDLNSFQARYLALRHCLVQDGKMQEVPFHVNDLRTLAERLKNEGTSFAKVTIPLIGKALDHGLVTGQFICPANFRMKRNTRLPIFCHSVFAMIFDSDGVLLPKPNSVSIFFLRQFLLFDAKLDFKSTSESEDSTVQGFFERQRDLRSVVLPKDHPVLIRARALLGRVLSRLDLSNIRPGHGPGVVAEKTDRFERWDFTYWSFKTERCYPYLEYGVHSLRASLERGIAIPLVRKLKTRCCLVPKDFKGPRLISAENAVNQYLQQGQMKSIMRYVDNHPILSKSIKLRDQTQNQRLAQTAVSDNSVTLDLSNASDTVSTILVWNLLADVPVLRRQLMSTRSDFMIYKDREIKLVAFAPMGSATCFPIETLVFWALSMASLMLVRHQESDSSKKLGEWDSFLSELASQVSVFGDDIIIPADALGPLVGTLSSIGCHVNTSKTCYMTPFRESCGTEWYNGSDVTIIRNRRYQYEGHRKFMYYPVLCSLQRKFFLRGLHCTADILSAWAREIYPCATVSIATYVSMRPSSVPEWVPLGSRGSHLQRKRDNLSRYVGESMGIFADDLDDSFFARSILPSDSYPVLIGWYDDLDGHMPVRWNRDYHRMEVRVPQEFQRLRNWISDGYPRLHARLSSDKADRIAIRDRKIKMAWSYIPCYFSLSRE